MKTTITYPTRTDNGQAWPTFATISRGEHHQVVAVDRGLVEHRDSVGRYVSRVAIRLTGIDNATQSRLPCSVTSWLVTGESDSGFASDIQTVPSDATLSFVLCRTQGSRVTGPSELVGNVIVPVDAMPLP